MCLLGERPNVFNTTAYTNADPVAVFISSFDTLVLTSAAFYTTPPSVRVHARSANKNKTSTSPFFLYWTTVYRRRDGIKTVFTKTTQRKKTERRFRGGATYNGFRWVMRGRLPPRYACAGRRRSEERLGTPRGRYFSPPLFPRERLRISRKMAAKSPQRRNAPSSSPLSPISLPVNFTVSPVTVAKKWSGRNDSTLSFEQFYVHLWNKN